jgi:hypothetical protein
MSLEAAEVLSVGWIVGSNTSANREWRAVVRDLSVAVMRSRQGFARR